MVKMLDISIDYILEVESDEGYAFPKDKLMLFGDVFEI